MVETKDVHRVLVKALQIMVAREEVAAETAEAGDHTVGAGAENAGIETGGNVQRRAAAVPKMAAAAAVERTHEIDSKRLNLIKISNYPIYIYI